MIRRGRKKGRVIESIGPVEIGECNGRGSVRVPTLSRCFSIMHIKADMRLLTLLTSYTVIVDQTRETSTLR